MPRIALIHATPVAMQPIVAAFAADWPEAELCNVLDDSLSADLARAGTLDARMMARFQALADYVVADGADAILFTCSAFGVAIEAVANSLHPLPVLKPNEAMFLEALEAGRRVGLLATFAPSLPSMQAEFEDTMRTAGRTVELVTGCVPAAMSALRDGDRELHDRLVAEASAEFRECDALMLAQFSMAPARDLVGAKIGLPVLTSPASAVAMLKTRLGQ